MDIDDENEHYGPGSLDFIAYQQSRALTDDDESDTRITEGEEKLKNLVESDERFYEERYNVDEIRNIVTARNLCCCRDPLKMAFEVNSKLKKIADTWTENTELLKKLADQTEDFAVQLIDQVTAKEELAIRDLPGQIGGYASLLGEMTDQAIYHSQKKFVTHPVLYKRINMRWNFGLPDALKPQRKFRRLLWLLILIDTVLTPILLPIIGYAFYRDQKKRRKVLDNAMESSERRHLNNERSKLQKDKLDKYLSFFTAPVVKFVKDKLSQVAFIAFHVRVCILASTVYPRLEEYLIFVFFAGLVLSEWQQYRASPLKYFRNMWNYLDIVTLLMYLLILILRTVTVVRGGDPYQNRVLEIVNNLYGVNTMLLVLRFSSILTLDPVIGPLQLALFRMLIDLLIIVVQFFVVVIAFSLAITKSYVAEMSYVTSSNNQTEDVAKYNVYCEQGTIKCLVKTSGKLMWSVFGLTELEQMESHTSFTSDFVAVLFMIFLVLAVVLLINMLVALLNHTYDNVKRNEQIDWKFSRAKEQSMHLHSIVVPFNLLSVPLQIIYETTKVNSRKQDALERRKEYRRFYNKRLFPVICRRYPEKYGDSFPLTVDEKIDLLTFELQNLKRICNSISEKQDENHLSVSKDLIAVSTSVDVDIPGNESASNGGEAKPLLTECVMQMTSSV